MELVMYPEQINKEEFLNQYAASILDCLKDGIRSSYPEEFNAGGDDMWYKYLNINLDNGVRYRILLENAKVIAYLVWHDHDSNAHIYDLIICPAHQGDGMTLRKLLTLFAEDVKDQNFNELVAYTNLKNDRMNGILIKHGFKVVREKKRGIVYSIEMNRFLRKFKTRRRKDNGIS